MVKQLLRIIKQTVQDKENRLALLLWVLPLLLALGFQMYGFGWNRIIPRNFVENAFTLCILLCFTFLLKGKLQKVVQLVGYFLFIVYHLFESFYYYLFKANISSSSIFILLETNAAEAREFAEFYVDAFVIVMVLVFVSLLLVYVIKQPVLKVKKEFKYQALVYLLGILMPLGYLIFKDFLRFNFYYLTITSVNEYFEEQEKMESYNIDQKIANIPGFEVTTNYDEATFIFVLGESTTRKRMSLYGYNRKTTPYLDSLSPELKVYKNTLSNYVYTIGALKSSLTLNGLTSEDDYSIIQLMNEAGFKTFWLSNQRPIGEFESLVTKIAKASDELVLKNTALAGTITPFDEILLPEFDKALKDSAKKKFIVLHTLGTHLLYGDRYPKDYVQFDGQSPSNFSHPQANRRSNDYDNAILYHDYILKNIFEKVRDIRHPVYVVYFSDHGEEVYETVDFSGHSEENPTKAMYEVPFFIWMNTAFEDYFQKKYIPNNPYNLKHFFHTFSDMNGIRFKSFDSTKTIFYQQDTLGKRKLGSGKYYEDLP
jgi:heptose-I-phosphate ethanolaminephosphotransferase